MSWHLHSPISPHRTRLTISSKMLDPRANSILRHLHILTSSPHAADTFLPFSLHSQNTYIQSPQPHPTSKFRHNSVIMAFLNRISTLRGIKYYAGIPALTKAVEWLLLKYTNVADEGNVHYWGAMGVGCALAICLVDEFMLITGMQ